MLNVQEQEQSNIWGGRGILASATLDHLILYLQTRNRDTRAKKAFSKNRRKGIIFSCHPGQHKVRQTPPSALPKHTLWKVFTRQEVTFLKN